MKFKDIIEGKLYQNKDFVNVYTKVDGLLYHMGTIYGANCLTNGALKNEFELEMYFVEYAPEFIKEMDFKEIKLKQVKKGNAMRFLLQFEMKKHHCIDCPIRSEEHDCCRLQLDSNANYLEFESWDEQMKNCPLEQLMDLKVQEKYMTGKIKLDDICTECGNELINNHEVIGNERVFYKQCLECEHEVR